MKARKPLNGGDLVALRSRGVKELPVIGTKDFLPTKSWLEGKQIQTRLDERYALLREERIEKISCLTVADWVHDLKKARVKKKAGNILETFGHWKDNDDWLYPEEALYLLETNSLELFYGEVRLSVERSYTVLIDPSNGCSLNQYRTYSYLNSMGYKLVRHTVVERTRMRNSSPVKTAMSADDNTRKSAEEEEVYIIDDDKSWTSDVVEVIPDVSSTPKDTSLRRKAKREPDCEIVLLDDEEDTVESVKCERPISVSPDSDRVLAGWSTFLSEDRFLSTTSDPDIIDLCLDEDDVQIVKREADFIRLDNGRETGVRFKSRSDILDTMPSAKDNVSFLKRPDASLIPANIRPRYSEYRVNLSVCHQNRMLNQNTSQNTYSRPTYRPYQNRNYGGFRWRYPGPRQPTTDPILKQAQEMQAMALGMMRVASTLMSMQTVQWTDTRKFGNFQTATGGYSSYRFQEDVQAPRHRPPFIGGRRNFGHPRVRHGYSHHNGNPRPPFSLRQTYRHPGPREGAPRRFHPVHENGSRREDSGVEIMVLDSDEDELDDEEEEEEEEEDVKIEINEVEEIEELPIKRENAERSTDAPSPKRMKTEPGTRELDTPRPQVQARLQHSNLPVKWENVDGDGGRDEADVTSTTTTAVVVAEPRPKTEKETVKREPEPEVIQQTIQSPPNHHPLKVEDTEVDEEETEDLSPDTKDIIEIQGMDSVNDLVPDVSSSSLNGGNDDGGGGSKDSEEVALVTSWAQFKMHRQVELDHKAQMTFHQLKPVLKPNNCTSIENILSALQIFEPFDIPEEMRAEEEEMEGAEKEIKISYDLYLPNVPYKKSVRTTPNFRIIVVEDSSEGLPSGREMAKLRSRYPDDVPFLFAIVIDESISFSMYNAVHLPEL